MGSWLDTRLWIGRGEAEVLSFCSMGNLGIAVLRLSFLVVVCKCYFISTLSVPFPLTTVPLAMSSFQATADITASGHHYAAKWYKTGKNPHKILVCGARSKAQKNRQASPHSQGE